MITARTTRLVRVPDLHTFRNTLADLARGGTPFDVRNRLVVVPTRAAATYLIRSIEHRFLRADDAVVLPDFVTRADLYVRLGERLARQPAVLTEAEREVLMGLACRTALHGGAEPPFRLRPGLIAEIVRFYDALQLNLKQVDTFERLALGMLEPGAAHDRGAERLVRQTRFLVAAFRHFERACRETGCVDEHLLREQLIADPAPRPWRQVVLAVGDRASDTYGLLPADWDVLARIPGLEQLDVVATDATVAGAFHERIHQLLPGIEETRVGTGERVSPVLLVPPGGGFTHTPRDREEEVAFFARWVRQEQRALDGMALVVRQPLPYVYVAREVLKSAGVPCQMVDALPLAAEPFSAALDLVFAFVTGNFARVPAIGLLRSPHFRFTTFGLERAPTSPSSIAALDRALSEAGYLGDIEALERLIATWDSASEPSSRTRRIADVLLATARELAPLREEAPCAEHLDRLLAFLLTHERLPAADDPLRPRLLRGRAAVLDALTSLRDAHARFDPAPVDFDAVAAVVKRWIEAHTFTPYTGEGGVHVIDADSARFGDFESVQLAGLVDAEWPESARRNIFYPSVLLRELGWPTESERLDGIRAAFADLLRLPSSQLVVTTFTLEDDAIVTASPLVDAIAAAGLDAAEYSPRAARIFDYEALAIDPVATQHLAAVAQSAALRRLEADNRQRERRGMTSGHHPAAYSLSALERYQDCPFKFFAEDVLRLEEPPEDEPTLSPRARGRFVHEVFQRFFEAWDGRGDGTITVDRIDEARALFEEVVTPMLARLPDAEAALERARLFGSAVSPGIVEVVLELEASRPADVRERWLEYRLEGEFSLGVAGGRRVLLKGVADRIDLLAGSRLRVIDYKSGYAPNPKRALQAPVYALCAQERLTERDGATWAIDEAAYVAFSGKRTLVPVIRRGAQDADAVLSSARNRLFEIVNGVERGEFSPRPYELRICGYCAYPSVCRKDYVGDD